MAWPSASDIQGQFTKLDNANFTAAKIPAARLFAIATIKSWLARCYSASTISGWDTSTPDLLAGIFYLLVYGWFAPRTHTGREISPSDQAAIDARKEAMEMLREVCPRANMEIIDSSGDIVARSSPYLSNVVHKRTEENIFTADEYEEREIDTVETGDEWEP